MLSVVDRHVIARESNVVRVDFSREPDPPAPCFPGANGLRVSDPGRDRADCAGASPVSTGSSLEYHGLRKEQFTQFRPLHDRVLVRRIEAEEKSSGGCAILLGSSSAA